MRLAGAFAPWALVTLIGCGGRESPIRTETQALLADSDDVLAVQSDTAAIGTGVASDSMDAPNPPGPCWRRERVSFAGVSGVDVYHLNGCGRSGQIKVAWQARALAFHVEIEGRGITIGTTLIDDASITADVVASGADRTMLWRSHMEGYVRTDEQPRKFSHDIQATLRWTVGVPCLSIDGTATGTLASPKGPRAIRVTTTGLRVCGGGCPEPNSRVRVDNLVSGQAIELRFVPDRRAVLTDTEGKLLPFRPACASRSG